MQLEIMEAGEQSLADAITAGLTLRVSSFNIGDVAGQEIDTAALDVVGNVTYSGSNLQVRYNVIGEDELTFILILEHDMDSEVVIGNIVLFLEDGTPLICGMLPDTITKVNTNTMDQVVGDRVIFHMNVWMPGLSTGLDLSNLTVYRAEFYELGDEKAIGEQPYNQFILRAHSRGTTPVLAVCDEDNHWYGNFLFQPLEATDFGVLDGGEIGAE